jgi:hypothetical protein
VTASDDCGACERFAVGVDVAFSGVVYIVIDGMVFEGRQEDVGRALAALATVRGEDAVERTKKTARVRAGRPRRTDGRR